MAKARILAMSNILKMSLTVQINWVARTLVLAYFKASAIPPFTTAPISIEAITKRNLCHIGRDVLVTLGFYSSIHNGRILLRQRFGSVCSWLASLQGQQWGSLGKSWSVWLSSKRIDLRVRKGKACLLGLLFRHFFLLQREYWQSEVCK